jgi:NAD(P)-dependent dehydrogenase (short-subunit alcohol dehydrogenase family)
MKDFKDKVAVITGGASGFGHAVATRAAREGMKLVLADIEQPRLDRVVAEFAAQGVQVIGVRTDVAKAADMEALAAKTLERFGAVHFLFNNAGVAISGSLWEHTVADWEWVLGVNVWGVIHGVRVFTPIMLKQGTEGHIVNTASVAGLLSPPTMGVYCVSKHAVVTLSECLFQDLAERNARVKCSVLCPAFVPTGIADSERNRPAELRAPTHEKTEADRIREAAVRHAVESGRISAAQVADMVFDAVMEERFYILSHKNIKASVAQRLEDIIAERNPTNPLAVTPGDRRSRTAE